MRPQDRPQSLEDHLAIVAGLHATLGVAPDLDGMRRFIAARVAERRVAVADTIAVAPGMCLRGRYELVRLLGEGGMGRVYLARDRQLGQPVTVKQLRRPADLGALVERCGADEPERRPPAAEVARALGA